MWETIRDVLTGGSAWVVILGILFIVIVVSVLMKSGMVKINTRHLILGNEMTQRELIRRQVETAHTFIMSLYGKIDPDENDYNRYFIKYILERVYDKVIEWIIFNHITTNQLYVQDKQESIANLVYSMDVRPEFKTPEFHERMNRWVEELVKMLVKVKEVYR